MNGLRMPGRRWVAPISVVLLLVVIGALLGAASAVLRGPTYTSQAELSWNPSVRSEIDQNYSAPDPTTFDREVADQADVILSDDVVSKVVKTLGVSATAVRDGLSVSTTAGRSQILVSGSGRTPTVAQRLARSATDAYVATLRSRNAATLQQRIDALKPVIAVLRKQLDAAGSTPESGALADDIATLQSQQAGFTVAAASVPVEAVVQREAELPDGPSSLSPTVSTIIGAALGAVLGVCIMLLIGTRSPAPAGPRTGNIRVVAAPPARDDRAGESAARVSGPDQPSAPREAAVRTEAEAEVQPAPEPIDVTHDERPSTAEDPVTEVAGSTEPEGLTADGEAADAMTGAGSSHEARSLT